MEALLMLLALSCFICILISQAGKLLNWAWVTPKRLEKCLREQGFRGNPYRLIVGDLKDNEELVKKVTSEPMPFNDDIAPRAISHLHKTVNQYGKRSFEWIGTIPRVVIMDPDLLKEVLTSHGIFQKHFKAHDPLTRFIFTGLGALEGDTWARHRRVIAPAFHLEKLKNMLPGFYSSWNELMNQWEKTVSENSKGWMEVDVFPIFDAVTSDVIAKTAFGSSYGEGSKIFLNLKDMMDLTVQLTQSIRIPGWSYLPTKRNLRIKKLENEVHNELKDLITKRAKAMKAGEAVGDDLLSKMLESNLVEIQKDGNKSAGLSVDEIIEECKLFYFAGQETTGILLSWTLLLLSRHPEWQVRSREEVLQAFGRNKPDFDGLNHLKIVNMILYESLRLYPPVFDLNKITTADTKIGDVTFPAGTMLMLPSILLHRNTDIWGEDAVSFNPERFSEGVLNATKNKVSFIPFSWGPRACLGQNFALSQAKLALAMVLQRFAFELSPSYAHAPFTILTLQPQYGAHMIFRAI